MAPKREPCRNFLRGSCQYGARCKFLHVAPQQSKPNTFGFGMQNVQQKSNPFGFGVQNQQPSGANDFGSKQNQFKPFENKWSRSSPTNNNNTSMASRKSNNQAPTPAHNCADPQSCKREILEDFQNERPMWTLTCYGHRKNGPCDIVGDISYEELRAAAYDDAKRGLSMQSIVERERKLLQTKLSEFESLAHNPYAAQSNPAPASQNPSPVTAQSNGPPLVSSFSQLGASVSTAQGISSAAPPSTLSGQQNPFQNLNSGPPSRNVFAQPNSFQNLGDKSSFGQNKTSFGDAGALSSQFPPPIVQSPFTGISASLSNGASTANGNAFSTAAKPLNSSTSADNRSPNFFKGPVVTSSVIGQSTANIQLTNGVQTGIADGDDSIWMKNEWSRGEIPDEVPPDKYIF